MDKRRLAEIEEYVLDLFRRARVGRLLTRTVFEGAYANADLVRAFENLEKKRRLLVRFTEEGADWVQLSPAGAELAGLAGAEAPHALPHPPKSSTKQRP